MRFVVAVCALGAFALMAPPSEAAKRPGTAPSGTSSVKKCKKGEIWKKLEKKCVKMDSGVIPDEDLYWQGRELALAGEYDWAIAVLSGVANRNDAEVLNFLGYSHRKAGRLDTGIGYYERALALDPDYVLVREYLGESYVSAGKLDLAREQLREIEKRCGTSCEEYEDLNDAIAKASSL